MLKFIVCIDISIIMITTIRNYHRMEKKDELLIWIFQGLKSIFKFSLRSSIKSSKNIVTVILINEINIELEKVTILQRYILIFFDKKEIYL